jgi:hypothetical protein
MACALSILKPYEKKRNGMIPANKNSLLASETPKYADLRWEWKDARQRDDPARFTQWKESEYVRTNRVKNVLAARHRKGDHFSGAGAGQNRNLFFQRIPPDFFLPFPGEKDCSTGLFYRYEIHFRHLPDSRVYGNGIRSSGVLHPR